MRLSALYGQCLISCSLTVYQKVSLVCHLVTISYLDSFGFFRSTCGFGGVFLEFPLSTSNVTFTLWPRFSVVAPLLFNCTCPKIHYWLSLVLMTSFSLSSTNSGICSSISIVSPFSLIEFKGCMEEQLFWPAAVLNFDFCPFLKNWFPFVFWWESCYPWDFCQLPLEICQ